MQAVPDAIQKFFEKNGFLLFTTEPE